jgi:hypothetical protein
VRLNSVNSGLFAAGLLLLSLGGFAPIGGGLDTFCVLGGVASAILFVGLLDGA